MSTLINPTNIDATFPVAGVNNNTATFRNNSANIISNFTAAANDINDLLNKAVVTAPLTNGNATPANNLNGLPFSGAVLNDFSLRIANHGTMTVTSTEPFDFQLGTFHSIILGGNGVVTTASVANYPGTGYSALDLQVTVQSSTTPSLGFGNLIMAVGNGVIGYVSTTNSITYPISSTTQTYLYRLASPDGETWTLTENAGRNSTVRPYTPSSNVGVLGDTLNSLAYDRSYLYVCTGNYDGVTAIWKRVLLGW